MCKGHGYGNIIRACSLMLHNRYAERRAMCSFSSSRYAIRRYARIPMLSYKPEPKAAARRQRQGQEGNGTYAGPVSAVSTRL